MRGTLLILAGTSQTPTAAARVAAAAPSGPTHTQPPLLPTPPTGPDGRFRLGCERTLRTLRANAAPLTALLEAALLDAGVDWDAEAAAKAASKVGGQHLAMAWPTLHPACDVCLL